MGKFALMYKKELEEEEKRKAQGVTYPTDQKVVAPSQGAVNSAPTIVWKQNGNTHFQSGSARVDNQTVISEMEKVSTEPDYPIISANGGQKWKHMKGNEDNLSKDPGFKRFQDFMTRNNFSGTVEGISSIPMMLGNNKSRYEPQRSWTPRQRNTFNYYYNVNPEDAKKYAQAVNDEYKRMNEEKTKQWAVKHPFLATGTADIMDQIALAETQHNELGYARDGQLPYTTQVTPSQYSTIVREAIREDLKQESGDGVIGTVYAAMDNALNSAYYGYLQKNGGNPLGMGVGAVNNYSSDYNNALYDALERGATEEEAIKYARQIGGTAVLSGLFSDFVGERISGNNSVRDKMAKEIIGGVAGGMAEQYADNMIDYTTMGENSRYNQLVKAYIDAGYSQTQAVDRAWQRLGTDGVSDVLGGMLSGMVYGYGRSDNSLKRGMVKK